MPSEGDLVSAMGGKRTLGTMSLTLGSGHLTAEARVQLSQAPPQPGDVLWRRCLKLAQTFFVDMRDLAGLDGLEKAHQPIPLLTPVLRAHERSAFRLGSIMSDGR